MIKEYWEKLKNNAKFASGLVGVIGSILIILVPGLEPLEEHITEIVAILVAYILSRGVSER